MRPFATILSMAIATAAHAETFTCAQFMLDGAAVSDTFEATVNEDSLIIGAFGPRRRVRPAILTPEYRVFLEEAGVFIVYGTTTFVGGSAVLQAPITIHRLILDEDQTSLAEATCE